MDFGHARLSAEKTAIGGPVEGVLQDLQDPSGREMTEEFLFVGSRGCLDLRFDAGLFRIYVRTGFGEQDPDRSR